MDPREFILATFRGEDGRRSSELAGSSVRSPRTGSAFRFLRLIAHQDRRTTAASTSATAASTAFAFHPVVKPNRALVAASREAPTVPADRPSPRRAATPSGFHTSAEAIAKAATAFTRKSGPITEIDR